MISTKGLDKARVLMALYDNARTKGLGRLYYKPGPLSFDDANELLKETRIFDYVKGRVLKVLLFEDEFDERLYDRDNGQGAAKYAIDKLKDVFSEACYPEVVSNDIPL